MKSICENLSGRQVGSCNSWQRKGLIPPDRYRDFEREGHAYEPEDLNLEIGERSEKGET